MGKFTKEEKIQAVHLYFNGTGGYRKVAIQLGIEPKDFHYWIKYYKYHGDEAFIKTYSNFFQFKLDVLNYVSDKGIREKAAIFNLSIPILAFQTGIRQLYRLL